MEEKQDIDIKAAKSIIDLREYVADYYIASGDEDDVLDVMPLLHQYYCTSSTDHEYFDKITMEKIRLKSFDIKETGELIFPENLEQLVFKKLTGISSEKINLTSLSGFLIKRTRVVVTKGENNLFFYNQSSGIYEMNDNILPRLVKFWVDFLSSQSISNRQIGIIEDQIKIKAKIIEKQELGNHVFSFSNKSLVTRNNKIEIQEHSEKLFSTYGNETLELIENAECPNFMAFLKEVFLDDGDAVRFIQEWFGYQFLDHADGQKFLIAYGAGANGKSVLFNVLRKLLSTKNTSATSMTELGRQFGRENLINKYSNICNESSSDWFNADIIKEISSGETINIDRKHEKAVTVKIFTKLTFLCNALPMSADASYGYERRLLVLPFIKVFKPEEQDPYLEDKLERELSGILNFAFEGLERLLENRFAFTESSTMEKAKQRYLAQSNPMKLYVQSVFKAEPGEKSYKNEIYFYYSQWLEQESLTDSNSLNLNAFWKSFELAFFEVYGINLKGKYKRSPEIGRFFVGFKFVGTVGSEGTNNDIN